MGADWSYDDLGPGLHVLREVEPLKRAGAMAARLRADLCATLPQAEAALAERSALPLLDTTTLSTLEILARRVARAERIAARTRDRAVIEVGQHLAVAGSGLAIHPTTIRDRAAAVDAARRDLVAAERALVAREAEQAAAEERAAEEAAQAQAELEAAAAEAAAQAAAAPMGVTPAVRRSRSVGMIIAAFGLGLVLLAIGAVPLWLALVPALVASLWALWYLEPREEVDDDPEGHAVASRFLAEVGATTDEVFGARRASLAADEQLTLLTARRDRAHELVRVAERAWHDLAGEDVDVDAVEEVVQRFDPQHEDARLLAAETAGVRAAEVVLHHFQQRWLAFWRELGLEPPPAQAGEAAVAELSVKVSRPIVLVGPATELGTDLARVAPAAPVVVLDGPVESRAGAPG